MREIVDIVDNEWSDSEDEVHTVTVLPPDNVDYVTDEEILDDDEIALNDFAPEINEVVGALEYETRGDFEGNTNDVTEPTAMEPFQEEDEIISEAEIMCQPSSSSHTSKHRRVTDQKTRTTSKEVTYKSPSSFGKPKWVSHSSSNNIHPEPEPLKEVQQKLFDELKDMGPLELFYKFFDDEVIQHIVDQTLLYAAQHNVQSFEFDTILLKRFVGILILSGYHTLPAVSDYWSTNPTLGVPIVKQCMARNKFKEIKKYIHLCNNDYVDTSDKMAKIRPLIEIINRKFMQFGVWSEELSIDEQMVPYFGRHSCKMYIKGKPIRFGYKLWDLCSSNGYLYKFIPYVGAEDNFDKEIGLGAQTVLRLTECIEFPSRHQLFFDNFFTGYPLMCILADKGLCATGTVRVNRIGGAQLKTGKKLPRGKCFSKRTCTTKK